MSRKTIRSEEYKSGYAAGYKACKSGVNKVSKHKSDRTFTYDHQEKYSKMWSQSNAGNLPEQVRQFMNTDRKSFIYGVWSILELMREDGLLPEATIDKWWKKITKS